MKGASEMVITAEHKDYTGAKIGMWLFLFTELLLFGGLFIVYAVYRARHPEQFQFASGELNIFMGTLNTIILLTSSLMMALSISAVQKANKKLALRCLFWTIFLGFLFLVNKYFEWGAKIDHGIFPNSPELLSFTDGEILFWGLYYVMTGLHGIHVIVGVILLIVMFLKLLKQPYNEMIIEGTNLQQLKDATLGIFSKQGKTLWDGAAVDETVKRILVVVQYHPLKEKMKPEDFVALENSGLYWHLVDIIWIFLFPLFYLIA